MKQKIGGVFLFFRPIEVKNYLLLLFIFLSVVSLFALFIMNLYVFPVCDDLRSSANIRHHLLDGNIFNALGTFIKEQISMYNSFMGSYTTTLISKSGLHVFSLFLFRLQIFIWQIMFVFSNVYLLHTLNKKYINMSLKKFLFSVSMLIIIILNFMPSGTYAETLLWYNGMSAYSAPLTLILLFLGILISKPKKSKTIILKKVLLITLAVLIPGSHIAVAVPGVFALSIIIISLLVIMKEELIFHIILLLIMLIGFMINIIAPGNVIRQYVVADYIPESIGLIRAIRYSIHRSGTFLSDYFLNSPLLYIFGFSIPFMLSCVKNAQSAFKRPMLITIISSIVFAVSFFPMLYTGQVWWPLTWRTFLVPFILMVWLLWYNLFYWCGWVRKHYGAFFDTKINSKKIQTAVFYIILSIMFIFSFSLSSINSFMNIEDVFVNKLGHQYLNDMEFNLAVLNNPNITHAYLIDPREAPRNIKRFRVFNNPYNVENVAIASFYRKENVNLFICEDSQFFSRLVNLSSFSTEKAPYQTWQIDTKIIKENILTVGGWGLVMDFDTSFQEVYVVFVDSYGKHFAFNSNSFARADVAEHFLNDQYENSGFVANIPIQRLPDNIVEITINILVDEKLFLFDDNIDFILENVSGY